jgi:hypothetical protein
MKTIVILDHSALTESSTIIDSFESRADAERALRALSPGSYCIARLLETNIHVEPPPPTAANVVVRGNRLVERKRSTPAPSEG